MDRSSILVLLRERIVAFAASRIRTGAGAATAEDVAQDTLLLLEQKYAHIETLEDLVPLALQIARYKLLGLHAKSLRRGEAGYVPVDDFPLADPVDDPEALLARRQRLERLESALTKLGDRCRTIFRLKLEGHTFPEIQIILGADSINTVYTWDFRCRKQLLEKIEESRP